MSEHDGTLDHADAIEREWRRVLPAVNSGAIGITGRITRIALHADREAERRLHRFRLSLSCFEVLAALHRAGPRGLSPTTLAKDQKMSSAGITGLLDQLERRQLLTRSADVRDRRRVILMLTTRGAGLVNLAAAGSATADDRLRRTLGSSGKHRLHLLLSRLLSTVEGGLDLDPADTTWCLARMALHINQDADALFQGFGLTHGGFQVLASLYRSGPPYRRSPSGLARGLMLSSAGMTGRMDQLVRGRLLLRHRDLDDRRGVVLQLTHSGIKLVPKSFEAFVHGHQRLLDKALAAEEQSTLARLLHEVLVSFEGSDGLARRTRKRIES
jgi:DNA-binding MarR family transcriptional regulator